MISGTQGAGIVVGWDPENVPLVKAKRSFWKNIVFFLRYVFFYAFSVCLWRVFGGERVRKRVSRGGLGAPLRR